MNTTITLTPARPGTINGKGWDVTTEDGTHLGKIAKYRAGKGFKWTVMGSKAANLGHVSSYGISNKEAALAKLTN